jgi:hypothetical protein
MIMFTLRIVSLNYGFCTRKCEVGISFMVFFEPPVEVCIGTSNISWDKYPSKHEAQSVISYAVFWNFLVDIFVHCCPV